jgi:hypothetical protein
MATLTDLLFRVGHAVRTRPLLQILVGVLLLVAGALEVLFGAGHGGLIPFGVLVLVGGATAIRSGNARARQTYEHKDPIEESRSRQPEVPDQSTSRAPSDVR